MEETDTPKTKKMSGSHSVFGSVIGIEIGTVTDVMKEIGIEIEIVKETVAILMIVIQGKEIVDSAVTMMTTAVVATDQWIVIELAILDVGILAGSFSFTFLSYFPTSYFYYSGLFPPVLLKMSLINLIRTK